MALRHFFCIIGFIFICIWTPLALAANVQVPTVLVSIKPLALLAKDLSPFPERVSVLFDASQDPHSQALRVTDIQRIQHASLFIWVGERFESQLGDVVEARTDADRVLRVEALSLQEVSANHHHAHGHHHDIDAHLWLSYENSLIIAEAMAKRFVTLYPNKHLQIQHKLMQLQHVLGQDKQNAVQRLLPYKSVPFGVYHDAYSQLVHEFQLSQRAHAALMPDEQLSLQRLISLKRALKGSACILADVGEQSQAQKLAAKLSLKLVSLDLLAINDMTHHSTSGFGYVSYLQSILGAFERCLAMQP